MLSKPFEPNLPNLLSATPMNSPSAPNLTLFTSPGRRVTLRDVLDATELRGDLPAIDAPAKELDAAAAESASEDWRIEKNLIAGEELDAWLAVRQISLDDFMHHFRGGVPSYDAQRLARWWIDGSIPRWAMRHAHGIAALALQDAPPLEKALTDWHAFVSNRLGGETALHAWLRGHQRCFAWLAELAQIETAYDACRAAVLKPESLARELHAQHFPLHHVSLAICQVPASGMARELLLHLRADPSARLAETAERLGFTHFAQHFFIGDLQPAYQQSFLSARAGECLEPMQARDHWRLCQLVEKTPPTLDHPEVLSRIQKRVVEQRFAELSESVVTWMIES